MNRSYGRPDSPLERSPRLDFWGYALMGVALVLALVFVCMETPAPAHADAENRDGAVPQVIVKVEWVPVPSPLVSTDRLVFDALTLAGEKYDVSPAYLACLTWKEARNKPWAWVVDVNGRISSGLGMLNEAGLLPQFYAWGYTDPYDAYEASDYLARKVAEGPATVQHNWTRAFEACR